VTTAPSQPVGCSGLVWHDLCCLIPRCSRPREARANAVLLAIVLFWLTECALSVAARGSTRCHMNTAIETNNLVKRYGDVTAVNGLSLRVAKGEIYAFLGLKGAGKTTTIRLLLGMVESTSGEARVLGTKIRVGERKPWDSVGYLVETADAYPELTVRKNPIQNSLLLSQKRYAWNATCRTQDETQSI